MARAKSAKKARSKKEFNLSPEAQDLIVKLHGIVTNEVTKHDKKQQKGKK